MHFQHLLFASAITTVLCTTSLSAEFMVVVNIDDGDSLNVRSAPNAGSRDIGDLQEGSYVDVKGYSVDGKWARITYRGQVAWVAARFLSTGSRPDGSSTYTGAHQVTGIKAGDPDGGLNVRSGYGTEYSSLGVLPNGVQVHVVQISPDGKWAQIPFGTQMGWVSRRYLNAVASGGTTGQTRPLPAAAPATAPDGLPLPGIFRVNGVAHNDTLNIRAEPQASAAVLLQAQNGVPMAVLGMATAKWAKVQVGGVVGFAHAGFLTRGGGMTNNYGLQLGTECIGTEPFWRMTFDTDNLVRMTLMGQATAPAPILSATFSATPTGYPYSFDAAPYSGQVNFEICSDGMSDNIYPMSIRLNTFDATGAPMVARGCCRLQ
ncbi:MAG: SH3 domain-containing protein [Rhodobacteraceae bacterium]|nr:SH3 domain-containing protein [Paracoccaceae bacterium]